MRPLKKRAGETESRIDTLSQLLAGEERLARQLEAAREEADRIVREAEDYARRTEDACAVSIEEQVVSRAAAAERQLRDELDRISAEAMAEVGRFELAASSRSTELVKLVFRELGVFETAMPVEQGA
jgi:vacuolar-type H+-ATPase subunit H